MNTSHTPGPWTALLRAPATIVDKRGCRVALCCEMPGQDDNEMFANARLLAAAPNLLSALRNCLEALEDQLQYDDPEDEPSLEREAFDAACAAIEKATQS